MMPKVPVELTDYIIDFLHKDARTLAACALVCRAWTPAARFHLFRAVILQDRGFVSSFQRLLGTSPDLGLYVRELTVAKFVTASSVFLPAKPPLSVTEFLPHILRQLPHLRALTLAHMDLKGGDGGTDLRALHHPTLSELSCSYCQFTDFADFVDLVHAFPALSSLSIAGLTWKEEARLLEARPLPATLRRLVLGREVDSERLFEWLLAAGAHRTVTGLAARCASERDSDLVGPFLKAAGPALRELELDWSFTGDKTIGLPATISLAECTALESLTLQFPVHYSTAVPWVPALLATLDSPSIRRVALEVRLLGSVDALQWAELSKVLGAPAFRSLETIAVDVNLWPGVHKDMAEVEGIVRTRLRPFEKKGMVRFGRA
ncbi:hypothetical protein C8Q73DRAFT_788228 [Cubamyces lactineus]|nr:hypothetical protein C8Q73DRAFT_788228 [Cubamyces lactineus]